MKNFHLFLLITIQAYTSGIPLEINEKCVFFFFWIIWSHIFLESEDNSNLSITDGIFKEIIGRYQLDPCPIHTPKAIRPMTWDSNSCQISIIKVHSIAATLFECNKIHRNSIHRFFLFFFEVGKMKIKREYLKIEHQITFSFMEIESQEDGKWISSLWFSFFNYLKKLSCILMQTNGL